MLQFCSGYHMFAQIRTGSSFVFLFFIFPCLAARCSNGVIDFAELLCALALICHGSQTQKMRFIFELLDYDSDGLISLAELFRFLYAFAATIATLRSPTLAAMSSEEEDEEARACVWEEAEAMFEAAELDTQTDIDFAEFSAWADNPVGLLDALVGSIMG